MAQFTDFIAHGHKCRQRSLHDLQAFAARFFHRHLPGADVYPVGQVYACNFMVFCNQKACCTDIPIRGMSTRKDKIIFTDFNDCPGENISDRNTVKVTENRIFQ